MATKPRKSALKRAMNPHVPLRAQTIPDKKKQASKDACRTNRKDFRNE